MVVVVVRTGLMVATGEPDESAPPLQAETSTRNAANAGARRIVPRRLDLASVTGAFG